MRSTTFLNALTSNSRDFEARLREAERVLAAACTAELELERKIASDLNAIAALQIDDEALVDGEAKRQLELRRDEEASLRDHLGQIEAGIATLLQQAHDVELEVRQMDEMVKQVLSANPEYVKLVQEHTSLAAAHEKAEPDRRELLAECQTKLPYFEQNPLYRYLKQCGYGTEGYRRTSIIHNLDGWIARLCSFQTNRANELVLLGIRHELETTYKARHERLDRLAEEIDRSYRTATEQLGAGTIHRTLTTLEAAIKKEKKRANDIHASLVEYAEKRDFRFVRARELFAEALKSQPAEVLVEKARQTPDKGDDDLVQHVIALQTNLKDHRERFAPLYAEREDAQRQYDRAKSLERTIGGSRYAGSQYEYSRGLDLDSLIVGFMAGELTTAAVESEVRKNRRTVETDAYHPSHSSSGGFYEAAGGGLSTWSRPSSSVSVSDSGSGLFDTSDSTSGGSFDTTDSF